MSKYVIAHDVGTSSIKTSLVSGEGEMKANASTAYLLYHPRPGWVEQDPGDYWKGAVENTRKILAEYNVDRKDILGIVFSTQAMGIIPVDRNGNQLRRNITWVDGRAEEQARWIMNLMGGKGIFTKIIGTEITGKDVVAKLKWLKMYEPEVYRNTFKVLDVNGYLKFRATGRMVAEWSGACSYVFDLKKKDWDRMIFKLIGFDLDKLPELVRSVDAIGCLTPEAAAEMDLTTDIKVFGGCDDTQSAAIGSGSVDDGDAHIYLGTSAWAGVTIRKNSKHRNGAVVLQSGDPSLNLLVGVTESAGSNLEWIIEKFYKYEKNDPAVTNIYDFINKETEGINDGSDHLIFTPWMLGERCPVSTTTTRGTIFNLGPEHTRGHIVNALLEGIGFNLKWILGNMNHDFGLNPGRIRAIGGGSVNERWMQGIANITGKKIETINHPTHAGALGAAACVFVGSGFFANFGEIKSLVKVSKTFTPDTSSSDLLEEQFRTYRRIYHELKGLYKKTNSNRF
jgi:xylulokinase